MFTWLGGMAAAGAGYLVLNGEVVIPLLIEGGALLFQTKQGIDNADEVKNSGSESKGSTGRTEPNNLKEQLAMEEVKSDPLTGATELGKVPMTDKRWPTEEGWVKMAKNIDGVEIHFNYNKI